MNPQVLSVLTFALVSHSALGQEINWANPSGGTWIHANNWSPTIAPTLPTHQAIFNLPGNYTVNMGSNLTRLGSIEIHNPDMLFYIQSARSLQLNNGITNHGSIVINPLGTTFPTSIVYNHPAPLEGTGTLRLAATGPFPQLMAGPGAAIDHGPNHTITGIGQIIATIHNDGLITADTQDGSLQLIDSTIIQGPNGRLTVTNQSNSLEINNTSVTGGFIGSPFPGAVKLLGESSLVDSTIDGALTIAPGSESKFHGTINNSGLIEINPDTISERTYILCYQDTSFISTGTIRMESSSPYSQIASFDQARITNGPDHAISGRGRITASIFNQGNIIADVKGSTLGISNGNADRSITNSGRLACENDSRLALLGLVITQTDAGSIDAHSGYIDYNTCTVINGTFDGEFGRHITIFTTIFQNTTNNSRIEIVDRNDLRITDSITNNGTIIVNPRAQFGETSLRFTNQGTLRGTGTLRLNKSGAHAQLISDDNAVITNSQNHTIQGSGRILAPLINNGLIHAGPGDTILEIESPFLNNHALILAESSASIHLNYSQITQQNNAVIRAKQSAIVLNNSSIRGGILETVPSNPTPRFIVSVSSSIDNIYNQANIHINPGQSLTITPPLTNDGLIVLNPDHDEQNAQIVIAHTLLLTGNGTIHINSDNLTPSITSISDTAELYNPRHHTISGNGIIAVPVTNTGSLSPGNSDGSPIGKLQFTRKLKINSTSTLALQIAGNDNADQIESLDQITLGGTLNITFTESFDPTSAGLPWSAQIINSTGQLRDQFHTITAPPTGNPNLEFRAIYEEHTLTVGAFCRADLDHSSILDFFDVSAFLTAFSSGNPVADFNSDGSFDFFDVSAFLTAFGAGCP